MNIYIYIEIICLTIWWSPLNRCFLVYSIGSISHYIPNNKNKHPLSFLINWPFLLVIQVVGILYISYKRYNRWDMFLSEVCSLNHHVLFIKPPFFMVSTPSMFMKSPFFRCFCSWNIAIKMTILHGKISNIYPIFLATAAARPPWRWADWDP